MFRDAAFSVRIGCCMLAAAQAIAADLVVRDLTLAIESEPTELDWQVERPGLTLSGSDEFATHGAVVGGLRWSVAGNGAAFGLIYGIEAALGRGDLERGGGLTWAEGRALLGAGWAIAPEWSLLALARAGAGYSEMSIEATAAGDAFTAAGTHLSGGPELALVWSPPGALRVWGGAGWRVSRTPVSGGGLDLSIEQSGPTISLGIAWGLSEAPGALE
jgi:hypothetical protein